MMVRVYAFRRNVLALVAVAAAGAAMAQSAPPAQPPSSQEVSVPGFKLPPSDYLSWQARKRIVEQKPEEGDALANLIASGRTAEVRQRYATLLGKQAAADIAKFNLAVTAEKISGVPVIHVAPKARGTRLARSLLIYLPGGAFVMASPEGGLPYAAHISGATGMHVVIVGYRQAPEATFPAASEDVAAVYRALLSQYRPSRIAIAGQSAGGLLTAQALAWFQRVGLPTPAAAMIQCAGGDARWGGDSWHWQKPMQGLKNPPTLDERFYYGAHDLRDPLLSPILSESILQRFPPTLVLTSTRAGEMSSAVDTHRRLTKAKVQAELHVWDGLDHCFFSDFSLPETDEAFDVMAKFLRARLAR